MQPSEANQGARPWQGHEASWLRDRSALAALGAVPLGIIGYALLAPTTGSTLASILVVTGVSLAWGARLLPALATGIGSGVALYLFFGLAMRVPLPSGIIERLLQ